jgi:pimeloyl-ACP methyl ester carboxylesterase
MSLLPRLVVASLTAQPWWMHWLGVEVLFYIIFRLYIIPRANQRVAPAPYRDYGESCDRYRIMLRILERTEKFARYWKLAPRGQMACHFREWFHDLDHVKAPASKIGALTAAFARTTKQRVQSEEEKRLRAYAKTLSFQESAFDKATELNKGGEDPLQKILEEPSIPDTTSLANSSSDEEDSSVEGSRSRAGDNKKDHELTLDDHKNHDNSNNTPASDYSQKSRTKFNGDVQEGDGMEYVIDLPDDKWTIQGLKRSNSLEFLAWIMFAHSLTEIVNDPEHKGWMMAELDMALEIGKDRINIIFPDDEEDADTERLRPFLVTLENVCVLHKPLFLYLFFYVLKLLGDWFLQCIGFRRITTKNGMVAWYRPGIGTGTEETATTINSANKNPQDATAGSGCSDNDLMKPILFFHGISPGGHPMYLPMLLQGIARDKRRGLIIVDNPSISWRISFHAFTEQETLRGIQDVLDACQIHQQFILAGHSYGTAPMTWVIHDPVLRHRISQVLLMDPITILLSEPSVVRNFFYAEAKSEILTMAATEVFTQYHCRRHMHWYNTELWLEDIPEHVPITIVLAGQDEIVNANRIRSHILQFHEQNPQRPGPLKLLYWKRARHCSCLTLPNKWRQMSLALLEHEEQAATTTTAAHGSRPKQE